MAKISLKNFRKFESLKPLELGWINLFVGKNNAGKSTVVKAIMLILDNLRSLSWSNTSKEYGLRSVLNVPIPSFRFDANGFHNLHIGTFERAKCNYVDDKNITFYLEYEGFEFEIVVSGVMEGSQVSMPIDRLKITKLNGDSFDFDFSKKTMTYKQTAVTSDNESSFLQDEIDEVEKLIVEANKEIDEAAIDDNAIKVAELQAQVQKFRLRKSILIDNQNRTEKRTEVDNATFNLSYFHNSIGENILVQYLLAFEFVANSQLPSDIKKNTKTYKDELSKRQYIKENIPSIRKSALELERLLSNINVDYIQAHAATQKLILSVDDKQDVNSRVIHEYYQENIQPGDNTERFVNKWLKEFEIGEKVLIKPLDGEGYYVKVDTGNDEVHLADMGMGSIQLIVLLLRLATIGNRSEKTLCPWWVIIEEPEQNLHPKLQSRLADLFEDFTQTFCDPYSNELIIETHSEYLIRRTQMITAGLVDGYDPGLFVNEDGFKVFYFPNERGKQPYDMEYLPNGLFAKKFDSGFFDEAGKMHMQILKNSKK